MEKKHKFLFILLIFISFFLFELNVATACNEGERGCPTSGKTTDGDLNGNPSGGGGGGTSNLHSGKCNGTCYYGEFGLRITIVDANGKRLSDTEDYVNSGISGNVYYFPGKKTKTEYIGTSKLSTASLAYGPYDYNLISSTLRNLPLFLNYSNGAELLKGYFERMPITKINNLFDELGYERGDYDAFTAAGDFIMVEPIAFVEWNYNYYGGTATELALLWEKSEVTAAATGGLGISSLTHGNLPFSAYISDSHFNAPNTLIGQGTKAWSILSSSEITGNNGMGVGLFWKFLDSGDEDPNCGNIVCDDLRTTDNPGVCDETGFYQDPTNWCCIKTEKYRKEEYTFCNTYCREEVQTHFPDSHILVKAGTHFTFDYVGRIESTVQCRKYIELDKWYSQYTSVNNKIPTAYNDWQRQIKISEAWNGGKIDTSILTKYNCSCSNKYAGTINYTSDYSSCTNTNCTGKPRSTGTTSTYQYTINFPTTYYTNENVTPAPITYSTYNEATSALASGRTTNLTKIKNLKEAYDDLADPITGTRAQLKRAINNCQSIDSDKIISDKTTAGKLKLYYKYEMIENDYRNIDLTVDNVVEKGQQNKETGAYAQKSSSYASIKDYNCDGTNKCTIMHTTTYNFPRSTSVYQEIYVTTTYNMDKDTYRYVLKSPGSDYGKSIYKEADVSDAIKEKGLYYYINYANLPVHYSLAEGYYNYYIKYSSIGASSNFSKYILEENPITYEESPAYQCSYGVYNEITKYDKDDKKWYGLNVVYRPIDLDNPFPGKSGKEKGRIPGVNWRYGVLKHDATVLTYDKTLVDYYITNNRGVTTDEVYNKEPMYEIVLTPSLIKKIRSYNDSQEKGYADFNMTCVNGRKCLSTFIRNSDFSDDITGCGTETWDACDTEDNHYRNK